MTLNLNQPLAWKTASAAEQATLKNLQANIIKSHGRDSCELLFVTFNAGAEAESKQFIKSLNITNALHQLVETDKFDSDKTPGGTVINFLLSAAGYTYLGLPKPKGKAFADGMQSRRTTLNDPAVNTWDKGYRQDTNKLHAVISIADDHPDTAKQVKQGIVSQLKTCGVIVAEETGVALKNAKDQTIEHFGFIDGRSIPLLLVEDIQKQNTTTWKSGFPLKQVLVQEAGDTTFENLGSFMVFRKLEQNVAGWNQEVAALSAKANITEALAGAYAVGRFKDGTPVSESSTAVGAATVTNDFTFASDATGAKCPFHAHIRKTNPRGDTIALGATEEGERAHLLVRRGISYGPPPNPANPAVTGSGLLFMAFASSLENQFEFTQQSWADSNNFAKGNTGQDPVIGQGVNTPGGQKWPVTWGNAGGGTTSFDFGKFVTMKGGEYFFAPSIKVLANLT